jgi:predicted metal-dependent peptidase
MKAKSKAMGMMEVGLIDLLLEFPFYATIAYSLKLVEDVSVGTACTDGRILAFNPQWIETLSTRQCMGLVYHEAVHVADLHHLRIETRDPQAWNIACDKWVNWVVGIDSKVELPVGGMPPENTTPEAAYEPPDPSKKQKLQGGKFGEVKALTNPDGSPLSEAQKREVEAEAKMNVQRALSIAKAAGVLPAHLARHYEELLEPVLPWREVLAQWCVERCKGDYSWRRPSPRYDVYLPILDSPKLAKIVFAVDTSGSMGNDQLTEAISEVVGCLQAAMTMGAVELCVAWCDTELHEQVIQSAAECKPEGGGGTSYAPVIDHYSDIAGMIYYTDGYCDDFGNTPEYPVVWLLNGDNKKFNPPYGIVLNLK